MTELQLAAHRAERIRAGIVAFAELQAAIAEAYRCCDWKALDYSSWTAYVSGEFGEHRIKLTPPQRRALVSGLHTEGVSIRAIGTALGVARNTVKTDLRRVGQIDPPRDLVAEREAWFALADHVPLESAASVLELLAVPDADFAMATAVFRFGDEALHVAIWDGSVTLSDAYKQVQAPPGTASLRTEIEQLAAERGVALDQALLSQLLAGSGEDQ